MNMDKDFFSYSSQIGKNGGSSSGGIRKNKFISNGQNQFVCTFNITSNVLVFVDGVLQEFGYVFYNNVIEFDYIVPEGTEVVIIN